MTMTTLNPGSRDGPAPRKPGRMPNCTSTDPYAVLGLVRGASLREIKRVTVHADCHVSIAKSYYSVP